MVCEELEGPGVLGGHGIWVGEVVTDCVFCHLVLCAQSWAHWLENEEGWIGGEREKEDWKEEKVWIE